MRSRKDDHIRLAAAQQNERRTSAFDDVDFVHHALAAINLEKVSTAITVGDWEFPAPLYINGMTGGTDTALQINRALAIAAAETGIPMASGSVGIGIDDPSSAESFTVIRQENPKGIVWANIGAGRDLTDAQKAVDLLEADGLQIHLNAIQETVMPEGTREFSTWLNLVEDIVAKLPVPVIIKEVGFGLSADTLKTLENIGVQIADLAGSGGTNFARIENDRGQGFDWMTHLGNTTVEALLDATTTNTSMELLASGGVRNPLDVVRSVALGAKAVGVAGAFLKVAMDEPDELPGVINTWIRRLREIQALMGARTPVELNKTDLIIRGQSAEFAARRGIDCTQLAQRGRS